MTGGSYARGQIFAYGVRLALAAALTFGGLHLVFGNNILRTAAYTLGTFGAVTFLAWCMELLLGSSVERVALERATQFTRHYRPVGGGAFESAQPLLGGPNAPEMAPAAYFASRGQSFKGRTLDLTLPEESATARDPLAAAPASSPPPPHLGGSVVNGAPIAGGAPQLPAGDEDFQDLTSLLRGTPAPVATPAAVPARAGGQ
jgi:hypothetical protein